MDIDQQRTFNILSNNPGKFYIDASDDERELFREWVKGVLREREVVIDFEKANGDSRSMTCTLQESHLPPVINKTTQKKENSEVCAVWDCTQSAWRSFRWDRVKRISFTLG